MGFTVRTAFYQRFSWVIVSIWYGSIAKRTSMNDPGIICPASIVAVILSRT